MHTLVTHKRMTGTRDPPHAFLKSLTPWISGKLFEGFCEDDRDLLIPSFVTLFWCVLP